MKKGIAMIPLILIVLLVTTVGVFTVRIFSGDEDAWIKKDGQWVKHGNPSAPKPTESSSVPLPTGEDIVRNFFQLIDEGKASEAVMAMTKINTENDSTKQAWEAQFNAFESIKIISIEAYNKEGWTDQEQEFKVNLIVQMKPEAANVVMPNYGFYNGEENIRWISLIKENNLWKINGIATGP
jgi:hypothetical protein